MNGWMEGRISGWMDRKLKKPYRAKKPGNLLTESLQNPIADILLWGPLQ